MRFLPERVESRREFVRTAGRYSLLGLLAAAAGLAARPNSKASQDCLNRGLCARCGLLVSCDLPPALSARRAQEGL